jgi:hypothetical protein
MFLFFLCSSSMNSQQFIPLYMFTFEVRAILSHKSMFVNSFFHLYDKEPILYVLTSKSAAFFNDSYEKKFELCIFVKKRCV